MLEKIHQMADQFVDGIDNMSVNIDGRNQITLVAKINKKVNFVKQMELQKKMTKISTQAVKDTNLLVVLMKWLFHVKLECILISTSLKMEFHMVAKVWNSLHRN